MAETWDIIITRPHKLGFQRAMVLAAQASRTWGEQLSLEVTAKPYGFDLQGKKGTLAQGMAGHLEVTKENIAIRLRLPILMRAARGLLRSQIEGELAKLNLG